MSPPTNGRPPVRSLAWPPPLPGRVGWSWVLGLPWRRRRVRRLLALLDGHPLAHLTLVDVGGGTGVGVEEAIRRAPRGSYGVRVVLDPQRGMLVRGLRRGSTLADRIVADGAHLPLADSSVDVALLLGVLCCMTDESVPGAVGELRRVLKPGGVVVVGVPRRRGDLDHPAFEREGFLRRAHPRAGWALYERPRVELEA